MEGGLRLVPAHSVDRATMSVAAAGVADPAERLDLFGATDAELASETGFTGALRRWWHEEEPDQPGSRVPQTRLAALDDAGAFVAGVQIRHRLTDGLRLFGGHIGYAVLPARRRQGCGTLALRLALPVAARLGLTTALITCHHGNRGSRRIVEANGGVLVDRAGDRLRYVLSPAGGRPETDISRLR